MPQIPKLILVDDHDLFRDGIKTLFELSHIAEVIGEASNGIEFLALLEKHTPDLALVDIDMPKMNGIDATREAVKLYPNIKILALSMFGEYKYYSAMIDAGAKGFLLKSSNKNELESAVKKVANGHSYFSNELLQDIVSHINNSRGEKEKKIDQELNEKEIKIIEYMSQGFSTEEIADEVFLSPKTVSNYRNQILQKTGCRNSTHLIFYAIKKQLISV